MKKMTNWENQSLDSLFEEQQQERKPYDYPMPEEFLEVSKLQDSDIVDGIRRANENYKKDQGRNFSFYNNVSKYLERGYKGDMPHDLYSLSQYFYTDKTIRDLFNEKIDESEFRARHADFYDKNFYSLSLAEKKRKFHSSDFGRRSLYQMERDAIASNILEYLICYHSRKYLTINKESSGNDKDTNTEADLVFGSLKFPDISAFVELKTKWDIGSEFNHVSFRGKGYETLKDRKAMTICIRMSYNNPCCVVLDMTAPHETTTSQKGEKDFVNVKVEEKDIIPFKFWEWEDMKKVLTIIYEKCRNRNDA